MSALLALDGLALGLGDFRLGPVTLSLVPGDYLVLLGPSGCGKTSLLKAIAGFYPVAPEALLLDGKAAGKFAPHLRRIGYVSQTSDLFPHLSVAGNVRFGLRYLAIPAAAKQVRFERIVGLLGLGELLKREPATLSGGEGRRVALARALVVDPHVLLLDEPLGMLDENARPAMLETLRLLHRELGTATLHVTHDREEAWAVGSHSAVMRAGKIEQYGTVEELFRRPATRFVAEFLGGANVFPARFVSRDGRAVAVLGWAEFTLDELPAFERGYLHLRPDNLEPAAAGSLGSFGATVRSVHDRGVYSEIVVETAGGNILRAHLVRKISAGLRVGEALHLRCTAAPHPIKEDARGG